MSMVSQRPLSMLLLHHLYHRIPAVNFSLPEKKSKEFLIHNTNNQKDLNAGIRWKIGSHKWLSHCLNQFFLPQTPKGKMSQQSFKWKDVTSTTGVIKTPSFHPKLEIGPSNQCAQKSVNNCFLGIKVNYHWSP